MSKWFIEVVKDNFSSKYHANMMIDGKVVNGLVSDVDYNTLREDVRQKTGIEILKRRDMRFSSYEGKSYAYIDATREREDCRVSLQEVRGHGMGVGWKPDFGNVEESVGKQVVLVPHTWNLDGFDGVFVDVGTVVKHEPKIFGDICEWAGRLTVNITERLYLDGHSTEMDKTNEYYEGLKMYDSCARVVALEKLAVIRDEVDLLKVMPLKSDPCLGGVGGLFQAYFAAMDFKSFSDEQLLVGDRLAAKYVGSQCVARAHIKNEMAKRFAERTQAQGQVDKIIAGAKGRAEENSMQEHGRKREHEINID